MKQSPPPPTLDGAGEHYCLAKLCPNFFHYQSTPIAAPIIESSPLIVINTEVCETLVVDPLTTTSITLGFESPSQFKGLGDVDKVVTNASSSINLTRGGKETKLPIKYQEMEWKMIRGRGRHGCRGRGSYH
ncbi:hypothetical protein F2Q70_00016224 [Brassica cretica]|uniref:Uncharacterized protein n=1 Tax=Brassica cretica TaxID=69181 RepID=A0A8S9HV92_BRACR|nr:hypothetical protein F2Q70_00016224 [Brassica cretica]